MNIPPDASKTIIDAANQLHHSMLHLFRAMRSSRSEKRPAFSKLSVLGRLYRDGKSTAKALAVYLRVQPQSLTRVIASLEKEKLIKREQNGTDRRESLLEITKAGARLLEEEIQDQRLELARTIAKELTPAEQEFIRIAANLLDRLAGATEAKAGPQTK